MPIRERECVCERESERERGIEIPQVNAEEQREKKK